MPCKPTATARFPSSTTLQSGDTVASHCSAGLFNAAWHGDDSKFGWFCTDAACLGNGDARIVFCGGHGRLYADRFLGRRRSPLGRNGTGRMDRKRCTEANAMTKGTHEVATHHIHNVLFAARTPKTAAMLPFCACDPEARSHRRDYCGRRATFFLGAGSCFDGLASKTNEATIALGQCRTKALPTHTCLGFRTLPCICASCSCRLAGHLSSLL